MARLELQGICKGWDYPILDALDLTVESGEFFVVVGPSGISKTTLLRIIAGLEVPDAGRVILDGKDITRVPPYHRPVALTFESYALYPHRSVFDNIASPLKAQKLPRAEIEQRVTETARFLRIEHLLPRHPGEASGGQMQRISLARTLVKRPEVFLFDEPISHLDARIRYELRREFHTLESFGSAATLYVTHDYTEALSLGHRIGVMGRAGLVQVGAARDIFERPNSLFVAQHIGQPPINVVDGTLRAEGESLFAEHADGGFAFPVCERHRAGLLASGERSVSIGIRPQHLSVLHPQEEAEGRHLLPGTVDVFEALGSMGVAIADIGGVQVTAITDPDARLEVGQPVRIGLRTERVFFFRAGNGVNLHDG